MADADHAVGGAGSDAGQQAWPPSRKHLPPRLIGQLPIEEVEPIAGAYRVAERVSPLVGGDRLDPPWSLLQLVRVPVQPSVDDRGVAVPGQRLNGHGRMVGEPPIPFRSEVLYPLQGLVEYVHSGTVRVEARLRSTAGRYRAN